MASRGILDGLKVVELATVIAGPTTCALLADMGADVIKVEPPSGDSFRSMGVNPKTKQTSYGSSHGSGFEHCNRGKRPVVLDFGNATDKAAMEQLVGQADVFVTNVRNSGLKNLDLDFDTLHAKHPRLIYAHLTAWGLGGPDENYPGYVSKPK
jgi:crotonobetainyl-CoA:carnitine CoA-transferase CaiB-like acyl-CoA transferase